MGGKRLEMGQDDMQTHDRVQTKTYPTIKGSWDLGSNGC